MKRVDLTKLRERVFKHFVKRGASEEAVQERLNEHFEEAYKMASSCYGNVTPKLLFEIISIAF